MEPKDICMYTYNIIWAIHNFECAEQSQNNLLGIQEVQGVDW